MVSSGAALAGSPLSGGYTGAKATQRFLTAYAQDEATRAGLDITFTAVLARIAPQTGIGRPAVQAYAARAGRSEEDYCGRRAGPSPRRSPAPPWSGWRPGSPWLPTPGAGGGRPVPHLQRWRRQPPGRRPHQHQDPRGATKACWRVEDLAGEVAWLRARGVPLQDLPELGTADGIADLGFALAAWLVDPDHNTIGLLPFKEPGQLAGPGHHQDDPGAGRQADPRGGRAR